MTMRYFRRFRMELDMSIARLQEPILPTGFRYVSWKASLLERHSAAKFESFHTEIDAMIFRCLGEIDGCQKLMQEISSQKSFLPETTWMVVHRPHMGDQPVDCGTIQGLAQSKHTGAIQNIGVVPDYRGYGLGRSLLVKSLIGFRNAGKRRVYLDVTAENEPAVNLYRSLGFRLIRTMYKAVEVEEAAIC